jgi:hypothetical protein
MTIGEVNSKMDYRCLIHKVGSVYKSKSGETELTEFENASFSNVFTSCLDVVGSSGRTIKVAAIASGVTGYIADATITIPNSNVYINIVGESQYTSNIIPSGDFPVFELIDCPYYNIEKISFFDNQAGKGDFTPYIRLVNHSVVGTIDKCAFYQSAAHGVGIGGYVEGSSDYTCTECWFTNNFFRNLNCPFFWESVNTSFGNPWINGLMFYGNNYSGTRYVEKTNLKVNGTYAGNVRDCEMYQSSPNAIGGFDYDDAGIHGNIYHKNVFLWDLNYAGNFYAKLSPRDYISIEGCSPAHLITGSGVGNGAYVERRASPVYREGIAQFSADGKTTDFTVTHGMSTPSDVLISPLSKDAAGPWYIFSMGNPTFVLRYITPPPPATPITNKNVQFHWECRL